MDDRIVPREGRCEVKVGEKTKQPQVNSHMGPTMELTWGQLWSFSWAMEQVVRKQLRGHRL